MIHPNHIIRLKGYVNHHGRERWDCEIVDASTGLLITVATAWTSASEAREKAERSLAPNAHTPGTADLYHEPKP
jgi:hypothetical protein